jgi:hypothetical protein
MKKRYGLMLSVAGVGGLLILGDQVNAKALVHQYAEQLGDGEGAAEAGRLFHNYLVNHGIISGSVLPEPPPTGEEQVRQALREAGAHLTSNAAAPEPEVQPAPEVAAPVEPPPIEEDTAYIQAAPAEDNSQPANANSVGSGEMPIVVAAQPVPRGQEYHMDMTAFADEISQIQPNPYTLRLRQPPPYTGPYRPAAPAKPEKEVDPDKSPNRGEHTTTTEKTDRFEAHTSASGFGTDVTVQRR